MNDGSPVTACLVDGEHCRKLLVLYANGLDGRFGDSFRIGSHGGNSIADETHLVLEHPRVVGRRLGISLPGCRVPCSRRVLVRQNASYTGHDLGCGYIYGRNPRMRERTAQDLDMQRVRQSQIGDELRLTCHQRYAVDLT